MAKPIINSVKAMSCENENIISFSYSGTAQNNTLRIYSTTTGEVVYEKTQTTMNLSHKIPKNSVNVTTHGTSYSMKLKVKDSTTNSETSWSDPMYVTFIHTPTFKFTNITENQQIETSDYKFKLSYSSADNEAIREYKFFLYDASQQLVSESAVMYDVNDMSHEFKGMSSSIYYVQAKGTTVNGYELDTGLVGFSVKYNLPSVFGEVLLYNDPDNGYISYISNVVQVNYNGTEVFQYEDGKIVLTDKKLYYDEGFTIGKDATLIISGTNLNIPNVKFFEANNLRGNKFYITAFKYDDGKLRYKLISENYLEDYVIYSPPVSVGANDTISFWVRKSNFGYWFVVYKNGTEVTE